MQTKEFIEAVNNQTNFEAKISKSDNAVIEVSASPAMICDINIFTARINFYEDNEMDLDSIGVANLFSLLHEYCLSEHREIPIKTGRTISESEYQELREKAEKLKQLESVLTGRDMSKSQEDDLPF